MSRPPSLPPSDHYPHGTRGRYVSGRCRCDPCRASNTRYYHERQARARALLADRIAELDEPAPAGPIAMTDSRGLRRYRRACPGLELEQGCPSTSYLRKDSKGGICLRCRTELAADYVVDAAAARRHIRRLSRRGIGRRSVAAASSTTESIVGAIADGTKTGVRRSTESRILAVTADAVAGAGLVDARGAWRKLEELLEEGFTKTELARRLGYKSKTPALQLKGEKILARNALRVDKFYRAVMAEADA